MVGTVIIGGIKRIGAVAGALVPLMVALYLIAGSYVLLVNVGEIPAMFVLIVKSAFLPTEASGAFIGGTAGYGVPVGMKRAAVFQRSRPGLIAHRTFGGKNG